MNLIKPSYIKEGATVGFLTASGPVYEIERVEIAKRYFERNGFNVILSDTTYTQKDFLAADDAVRLAQLHEFFADERIDAIFCTRGGYGAIRLLPYLDFELIRKNPKIFGGFSDATAFLTYITANCSIETYHTPMPYPDFGSEHISEFTSGNFLSLIKGEKFSTVLKGNVYFSGVETGILWGGNLATLSSMVGLNFVPNEKFILFLEDVNEPAYKVDRYLTQLSFDKRFLENLGAILLGSFTGIDSQVYFDNIFYDFGNKYQIPIMSGLKIGHVNEKISLPLGRNVTINTQTGVLEEVDF